MNVRRQPRFALLAAIMLCLVPAIVRGDDIPEPEVTDGFVISGAEIVGGELDIGTLGFLFDPLIDGLFTGSARLLVEVLGLDDDEYLDDEEIEMAFYSGIDQDDDAEDDFDGEDVFNASPTTLTAEGEPRILFTPGDIVEGVFSVGPATLDLADLAGVDLEDLDLGDLDLGDLDLEDLEESFTLEDVTFSGLFEEEGDGFTSDPLELAIPGAVFEEIELPFPLSLAFDNVLDYLLDDGIFGAGAELDIDLDDDGENDAFSLNIELTAVPCQISHPVLGIFLRGDADGNGSTSALPDGLFLLQWGFNGGPNPPCMDAADADDSGVVSALPDALYILQWGFTGGEEPPAPGPSECGYDPDDPDDDTDDDDVDCDFPQLDCPVA